MLRRFSSLLFALQVAVGADDSDRQQQGVGSWLMIRDKLGERRLSGADKVYNNGLKDPAM